MLDISAVGPFEMLTRGAADGVARPNWQVVRHMVRIDRHASGRYRLDVEIGVRAAPPVRW